MSLAELFSNHLTLRLCYLEKILAAHNFDALIISSGSPVAYFAPDCGTALNAVPHFNHYCPLTGPHHALKLQPGQKPALIYYAPESFWHDTLDLSNAFWLNDFDLVKAYDLKSLWAMLKANQTTRTAYIGDAVALATNANLEPNPVTLTASLDWGRKYKTLYEIKCIEEATAKSASGHLAGQLVFLAGACELDIHYAFMQAAESLESELAFPTIVAINEKSAILHYENKRTFHHGQTLLMDCGVRVRGYAADITRTIAASTCSALYQNLITSMEQMQQDLIASIIPGTSFTALHQLFHYKLAQLLKEHNILDTEPESAVELGITKLFCPHKLGHHLGIQVHDVTGQSPNLANDDAVLTTPQVTLPTDQILEADNVITIEPGCYFIPTLLEQFRNNQHAQQLNWPLIDQLSRFGGIRIEDDIHITATGYRNITREYLPN